MAEETDKKLTDDIAETPVEALDLSVEVYKALRRTGISTVGDVLDLLEKGDSAVMSIRNFGEKSLNDLRVKMVKRGYLKDEMSSFDEDSFLQSRLGGEIKLEKDEYEETPRDIAVKEFTKLVDNFNNRFKEIKEIIGEVNTKSENEIGALRATTTGLKSQLSNFIENNVDVIVAAAEARTIPVILKRLEKLEEESERKRHWNFNYLTIILSVLACLFGSAIALLGSYLFR